MNKKILIIASGAVVISLGLIWAYLFVFGTPSTADDVFTKLGLEGDVAEEMVPNETTPTVSTSTLNINRAKLRQLSTRPVAGYGEIVKSTSTAPVIYLAELGTGHIYSIDLTDGAETRISATTFAQADHAVFSNNGALVAISTNAPTKAKNIYLGTIGTTTKDVNQIFETVSTGSFSLSNNDFLYTNTTADGVVGYAYSVATKKSSSLFSAPFYETKIIWGKTATSSHYIYPKSTYALEGFLYEAKKSSLERLPVSGFGLTTQVNDDIILYTKIVENKPATFIYNRTSKETKPFAAAVLTDKCYLPESGYVFYCGFEGVNETRLPDAWYQGSLSFKDSLFALSAESMLADLLSDTLTESGRELDMTEVRLGESERSLYFINKNDNTLWLYEI